MFGKFLENVLTPSVRVLEGAGKVAEQRIGSALESETQRRINFLVAAAVSKIQAPPSSSSTSSDDSPPRMRWFGSSASDEE